MSESLVGVSVTATRQNAGSDAAYAGDAALSAGLNAPADTTPADVTRPLASEVVANDSHVIAVTEELGSAGRSPAAWGSAAQINETAMVM